MAGSATASTSAVAAGGAEALAKTVDYLVRNAENLKRSASVAGEAAQRAYINSTLAIQQIMQSATPAKDAYLQNGLKWVVEGTFNGSKDIYGLVIDVNTQTIVHFLLDPSDQKMKFSYQEDIEVSAGKLVYISKDQSLYFEPFYTQAGFP